MRVAIIGLGTMGAPMARRLAAAGHELSIYDVNSETLAGFRTVTNARIAMSPADAAGEADILITMLPESSHVREALLGQHGAATAMKPGGIVLEMSTGDVQALSSLSRDLTEFGLRLIDAPVGRTPLDAERGTLLIMVGASENELSAARPILECLGDEIVHVGPSGSGLKLKLVNNYMSMIGMVMTAETLNLAQMLGLDLDQTVHVLQRTTAGRGQINVNFPNKVLRGDISPDFPLRLGLKDIGLGVKLAQSTGAPTPLGAATQQMFAMAELWGRSEQDCTAMLHLMKDMAGPPAGDTKREKT
ncbi:MAG: NAD(P)-dependent oxidoreductase [Hyphomicrobiales bacterium]